MRQRRTNQSTATPTTATADPETATGADGATETKTRRRGRRQSTVTTSDATEVDPNVEVEETATTPADTAPDGDEPDDSEGVETDVEAVDSELDDDETGDGLTDDDETDDDETDDDETDDDKTDDDETDDDKTDDDDEVDDSESSGDESDEADDETSADQGGAIRDIPAQLEVVVNAEALNQAVRKASTLTESKHPQLKFILLESSREDAILTVSAFSSTVGAIKIPINCEVILSGAILVLPDDLSIISGLTGTLQLETDEESSTLKINSTRGTGQVSYLPTTHYPAIPVPQDTSPPLDITTLVDFRELQRVISFCDKAAGSIYTGILCEITVKRTKNPEQPPTVTGISFYGSNKARIAGYSAGKPGKATYKILLPRETVNLLCGLALTQLKEGLEEEADDQKKAESNQQTWLRVNGSTALFTLSNGCEITCILMDSANWIKAQTYLDNTRTNAIATLEVKASDLMGAIEQHKMTGEMMIATLKKEGLHTVSQDGGKSWQETLSVQVKKNGNPGEMRLGVAPMELAIKALGGASGGTLTLYCAQKPDCWTLEGEKSSLIILTTQLKTS